MWHSCVWLHTIFHAYRMGWHTSSVCISPLPIISTWRPILFFWFDVPCVLFNWLSIRDLLVFLGPALIKNGSPVKIVPPIRPSVRLLFKKLQDTRTDLCKTWLWGAQLNFVPPFQVTIRSDVWHDVHAFCPNLDLKLVITGWIRYEEEMFRTNFSRVNRTRVCYAHVTLFRRLVVCHASVEKSPGNFYNRHIYYIVSTPLFEDRFLLWPGVEGLYLVMFLGRLIWNPAVETGFTASTAQGSIEVRKGLTDFSSAPVKRLQTSVIATTESLLSAGP